MNYMTREEVILKFTEKKKYFIDEVTELEKKNMERTVENDVFYDITELDDESYEADIYMLKSQYPDTVDLREYDSPDRDEQDNGKCTAWALTSCMENMLRRGGRTGANLSEWHLWSYYKKYSCATAIKTIGSGKLVCDERFYPQYGKMQDGLDENKHATITKYRYIKNDVDLMIDALSRGNVCYLGMSTPRSMLRGDKVIDPDSSFSGGGHALAVVGYYKDARVPGSVVAILKNSWGKQTGDNGYQYLPIGHYAKRSDGYLIMWEIEEVASRKDGHIDLPKTRYCTKWKRIWYMPWKKKCLGWEYR